MDLTLTELLHWANRLTVTGLLFLILYGGSRGWWVFGWQYRLKVEEAAEWKRLALAGTQLAATATETAGRAVRRVGP